MPDVEPAAVSVVFLAYNRREALRESLRMTLAESGYPRDRLQVVVVDNASDDGTAAMVRADFPEVELLENERNVGAAGWNAGFRVARGDYVLILDDDAYLEPGHLGRAVTAAREEQAELVSFTVVSSIDGNSFNDSYRTGLFSYWGCAALVSRPALNALGGYDPHIFIWANELDFTMRLLDGGFRHLFLPEARAVHMKETTWTFDSTRQRVNARHYSYIAAKLMRPGDALVTLWNVALRAAVDSVVVDRRALKAIPGAVAGFAQGLRHRRPVRQTVSATYRRNFGAFVGPWRLMRSPRERWRGRAEADPLRAARHARWYEERAGFYPESRASLRL